MPGGFPIGPDLCNAQILNSAITNGSVGVNTVVTSGSTANTKGSWASIGTTLYDACWLRLQRSYSSNTSGSFSVAMDLGVGSSGNQFVLVPDLMIATGGQFQAAYSQLSLPLSIPAGTNLWIRSQSNLASNADRASLSLQLYDGGFTQPEGYCGVDAIGFVSAAPTATVTTPIASPGVVSWTSHGLVAGQSVSFSGGTLPTGITSGTNYFVIPTGLTTNAFEIATATNGTAINFTGTSSGTQTGLGIGTTGTPITLGNGVMGSYSQLTAATTRDYAAIAAIFDPQGPGPGGHSAIDIAIGAGGSEVVICPRWIGQIWNQCTMDFIGVNIPAGTRLAARGAQLNGNAGVAVGVTLYGLF